MATNILMSQLIDYALIYVMHLRIFHKFIINILTNSVDHVKRTLSSDELEEYYKMHMLKHILDTTDFCTRGKMIIDEYYFLDKFIF